MANSDPYSTYVMPTTYSFPDLTHTHGHILFTPIHTHAWAQVYSEETRARHTLNSLTRVSYGMFITHPRKDQSSKSAVQFLLNAFFFFTTL